MTKNWLRSLMIAALLATVHAETGSADEMRTETIKFAAGASEASVSGLVKGYDSVDYLVSAEAGQTMVVGMTTDNASSYFNILAPGESDVAFYVGSTGGNNYSGSLPLSGEYKVRVYLMRNAARRNETANYTLDVMIAPADYADGLQGGPDYWEVTGVAGNDQLNIRSGPSTSDQIVAKVNNGAALRNMGCKMNSGQRWCQVQTVGDDPATGWAAGSYLIEGSYRPVQSGSLEPETRTENVKFAAGANGTVLSSTLRGGDAINYVVGARNGQFLSVSMLQAVSSTHFNIFMPNGELLYESAKGGANGANYRGQLYMDGDNTISVYSLGAAGTETEFELDIRID